jgi:hypothetical protein
MAKNVVENFHAYCKSIEEATEDVKDPVPEDQFTYYDELRNSYQKKGDQIFYQFLNKVYDSSET